MRACVCTLIHIDASLHGVFVSCSCASQPGWSQMWVKFLENFARNFYSFFVCFAATHSSVWVIQKTRHESHTEAKEREEKIYTAQWDFNLQFLAPVSYAPTTVSNPFLDCNETCFQFFICNGTVMVHRVLKTYFLPTTSRHI